MVASTVVDRRGKDSKIMLIMYQYVIVFDTMCFKR